MRYIRKKDLKAKIERQVDMIFDLKRGMRINDDLIGDLIKDIKQLSNRITELEHPEEFKKGDKVKLLSTSESGMIKSTYIGVVVSSEVITKSIGYRVYEIITPDGRTVYSKGSDLKKTK
tara:strand:+ start:1513 stop:1869 length:357 start_codon:yes stop_codon:yes gene_type:complete